MKVSLIITTYNWKEALELSLLSVQAQSVLPFEIIVADDGSTADTFEMIAGLRSKLSPPLVHSWQEDDGFRLARSRNKAIAKARGDYIILIDGDILLEKHFIEDHSRFARDSHFVQGTRVLLDEVLSNQVLLEGDLQASIFTRGVENKKNCIRSNLLARCLSFKSKKIRGIKTCNFAFWKTDAVAINGFNEAFVGWGREDSEFTARLLNAGVKRQNVKFNALGFHLYHPMNTRDRLETNDGILQKTIEKKLNWCDAGLDQYLENRL